MADLISRKALIAEYDRVHVGKPGGARKLMEDAPSVDAVEVVHGRWIHRPDERRCPFCGYHYSYFGGKDYNYCPNCGAKMDGDGNG